MPDWVVDVLKSEFFWGVMVGLILSVIGAYYLALFAAKQQRAQQKETVKNFCADTIKNLRQIVDDMAELRTKVKAIHHDYLMLMDVEIGVFGRNREHLITLPEPLRHQVRKFVTDCALRRAEIANHLSAFDSKWRLADELRAQGHGPESERARTDSNVPLAAANKALDDLIARVSSSATLSNDVRAAR
jgi:hypothetical protein